MIGLYEIDVWKSFYYRSCDDVILIFQCVCVVETLWNVDEIYSKIFYGVFLKPHSALRAKIKVFRCLVATVIAVFEEATTIAYFSEILRLDL